MSNAGISIRVSRESVSKIPARFRAGGKYDKASDGWRYNHSGTDGDSILMRVLSSNIRGFDNEDGTFVAGTPRVAAKVIGILASFGLKAETECLSSYGCGNHGGYFHRASDKQAARMMAQVGAIS